MVTRDDVLSSLQGLAGPDGRPRPASGALSEIIVQGGRVYFSIAVDPARAAAFEGLRAGAEAAVRALPGVEAVIATLMADRTTKPPPGPAPGRRR